MADSSQLVFELILIVIVITVGMGGLFVFLNRRLKTRIAELRGQAEGPAEFVDDRSYNLIRIARAEAAALKREGYDVHVAEAALADADAAIRRTDYDVAVSDARRAHELLVGLRKGAPSPSPPTAAPPSPLPASRSMTAPPPSRTPRDLSTEPPAGPPIVGDEMPPADPPAPRLAKNRAESRFQIGLLNEELAGAAQTRPADSAIPDAQKASADAQSAYDRAEYTEAMRLALRGRRKLGTRIESLPPPNTRIAPTPPAMMPVALDGPAGTAPCIQCGRPLKPADRFCRACGTPKAPTACPSCGTTVEVGDRFCPACGVTIA